MKRPRPKRDGAFCVSLWVGLPRGGGHFEILSPRKPYPGMSSRELLLPAATPFLFFLLFLFLTAPTALFIVHFSTS